MVVCENLTVSYDGNVVLKDVSFKINKGEYITVIGENGSGKTTLFKAILGELTPDCGKITVDSGGAIGYLPQNMSIDRLLPAQVKEIVLSGFAGRLKNRPFFNAQEKKMAEENLIKLGIFDLKHKYFNELSGGQKQRVLLARALCAADKFIMLDEPVSALDVKSTSEFYATIDMLHKEDGITILMISHDPSAVKSSDRVLVVSDHSVIMQSASEYLSENKYDS